jgi:low affinity Fe/Cu permease
MVVGAIRKSFRVAKLLQNRELEAETARTARNTTLAKPVAKIVMSAWFSKFARLASQITGSAPCFLAAVATIAIWALCGPMFHYSNTWQLVINTGTTIVTFLMVFLIQNAQNRDAKSIQLKLDELILSHKGARNKLIDLEKLSDDQLTQLEVEYKRICKVAGDRTSGGSSYADT